MKTIEKIFEKYAELLDRHLEVNEELRLFFEKHPDMVKIHLAHVLSETELAAMENAHHVIKQTGKMNINCLTVDAPFKVFEVFGFQSGRNVDKFADCTPLRSDNGLVFLPRYINSFMSLQVESYIDCDTHGLFICTVTEARVISDRETMTYTYYFENVKPKPQTEGKKGYVCKICGWVYEGDTLPDDLICPLCKHPASDFEEIK